MSTYTRSDWAKALLAAVGNTMPTPYTLQWVICWTEFETAYPNSASYNLLNTTQPLNGSTGGGSQGNIQNYNSFSDGITANAMTLKNGNYNNLLQALQFNDEAGLQEPDAGTVGIGANLNTWGTGHATDIASCALQSQLAGSDKAGAQTFSGNGNSSITAPVGTTSSIGATSLFPSLTNLFSNLQPLVDWLSNPVRLFKLVAGIGLILLALTMLVAPDAVKTVAKNPELLLA